MLIGEVARRSGVSPRMLRHYDRLGLVAPTGRTTGGYREYSADDVRRLFHVESLRTLGLSLQDVREAMARPGFSPAALVSELMERTRERIATEQDLLARLERVQQSGPTDWADVVHVVTQARALDSESGARRQQAILAPTDGAGFSMPELVKALLSESDPNVSGALRWALARDGGAALDGLSAGLDSPEDAVRRRAVSAIAAIDHPNAIALLRRGLDDADRDVRERAAIALAGAADPAGIPTLIAMIVDGHRDVEASEALGGLSPQSPEDIVAALRAHVDATSDAAARLRITQSLAEIPVPAADDLLDRLTADPDRAVAATAQVILSGRG